MGSLGSMGLLFGWMIRPHIPVSARRADSMRNWKSIASSSKYGLGLFATGAQFHLLEFLSSTSGFQNRCKRCTTVHCSEHHKTGWLQQSRFTGAGGLESPADWTVGILLSKPWKGWNVGRGQSSHINKRKVVVAAFGGESEGISPDAHDKSYPSRTLTNVILGLNILVFLGQVATKGRLLLWGAKVNGLIDQGQIWRLLTPTLLHANIFHLLVNSYSLNSIGPTVESLAGPKRFLAVYSASALASTSLSYYYCIAPSVGASGAIFGLVGALAVFLVRHKNMMAGGQHSLQQVARVIAINMVLGLVSEGIDNWSHLGGLLGGAAITWLLGPVYSFEMPPGGGKKQLVDRPPISYLLPSQVTRKR